MLDETALDRLTALTEGQFEEVLRQVGVPKEALPGEEAGRTEQARALLDSAREKDPTLAPLEGALGKMHPVPVEPQQRLPGGLFMLAAAVCFALLGVFLLDRFAGSGEGSGSIEISPTVKDSKY